MSSLRLLIWPAFLLVTACSMVGTTRAIVYYRRAHKYVAAGDYDRAIAYYDTTIAAFSRPLASEVFIDRGEAYFFKGSYERAIADFDTALAILGEDARALADRATAYRRLGQYGKAIPDYAAALDLSPNLTWARYGRAQVWQAVDSLERAIADLDTVLIQWKERSDIAKEREHLVARLGR